MKKIETVDAETKSAVLWTRDEVRRIVVDAPEFYEEERTGQGVVTATANTLIEVDGSLDFDEMEARGEVQP